MNERTAAIALGERPRPTRHQSTKENPQKPVPKCEELDRLYYKRRQNKEEESRRALSHSSQTVGV